MEGRNIVIAPVPCVLEEMSLMRAFEPGLVGKHDVPHYLLASLVLRSLQVNVEMQACFIQVAVPVLVPSGSVIGDSPYDAVAYVHHAYARRIGNDLFRFRSGKRSLHIESAHQGTSEHAKFGPQPGQGTIYGLDNLVRLPMHFMDEGSIAGNGI